MRLVFFLVLAVSVGSGAYFGSAQLAGSATKPAPRTFMLHTGDTAVVGRTQCVAVSDSRSHPMAGSYMRCSKRPLNQSRYHADVSPDAVVVWQAGKLDPLYITQR